MSDDLGERVIDAWDLARHQQSIQGDIGLRGLSRLSSLLAQDDGQILLNWQFDLLEHHAVIVGVLDVRLSLLCQRCLLPVLWCAQVDTALCLLKPWQNEQNLPAGFDCTVLSGCHVRLAELVEDEILLGLPFAPVHDLCPPHDYHEDVNPSAEFLAAEEARDAQNPFLSLSPLKRRLF